MATAIFSSPIKKLRGETVSLTSTASHLLFRPGYHEVLMYNTSAWRMSLVPRLQSVVYYNGTTYTHYETQGIDRDDSTHVPLDAMATTHYLYLGTTGPVRGFYFNVDTSNKNDNAATLDWEYCSAISAGVATFTDVAGDSDGTDSGGDTLKQDGLYSFTLPTTVAGHVTLLGGGDLHWYRFKPSAQLSATIDLIDIIPAAEDTNYSYQEPGQSYQFSLNIDYCGAFELIRDTADGTLRVTWIKH